MDLRTRSRAGSVAVLTGDALRDFMRGIGLHDGAGSHGAGRADGLGRRLASGPGRAVPAVLLAGLAERGCQRPVPSVRPGIERHVRRPADAVPAPRRGARGAGRPHPLQEPATLVPC